MITSWYWRNLAAPHMTVRLLVTRSKHKMAALQIHSWRGKSTLGRKLLQLPQVPQRSSVKGQRVNISTHVNAYKRELKKIKH